MFEVVARNSQLMENATFETSSMFGNTQYNFISDPFSHLVIKQRLSRSKLIVTFKHLV